MTKNKADTAGKRTARPLSDGEIEKSAEILKALANPARLRLVNTLIGGEMTVSQLCDSTGLKQSMVSQQLKRSAEMIAERCSHVDPKTCDEMKQGLEASKTMHRVTVKANQQLRPPSASERELLDRYSSEREAAMLDGGEEAGFDGEDFYEDDEDFYEDDEDFYEDDEDFYEDED